MPARFAARPATAKRRGLALKGESFGQREAEMIDGRSCVFDIIAVRFARQQCVEGAVRVVIPLRLEAATFSGMLSQQICFVVLMLQDQVRGTVQAGVMPNSGR